MLDRKQIKRDYKEKIKDAAVYTIINEADKKVFIGKTRFPKTLLYRLNMELNRGTHPYKDMVEDYDKLGKNNFDIKIYSQVDISKLEEQEVILKLEDLYEKSRKELGKKKYSFYNPRPGH